MDNEKLKKEARASHNPYPSGTFESQLWNKATLAEKSRGNKEILDAIVVGKEKWIKEGQRAERKRCAEIVRNHYWDSLEYEDIGKLHGEAIATAIEKEASL